MGLYKTTSAAGSNVGRFAKLVVGLYTAALLIMGGFHISHDAWYPGLVAALGAVVVYVAPNATLPTDAEKEPKK